jgi:hypothetical protein
MIAATRWQRKSIGKAWKSSSSYGALPGRQNPDCAVITKGGCLVVELKAVTELTTEHEARLINYMRITRQPVGYLVNFGHKDTLEWKRLILSEFIPPSA